VLTLAAIELGLAIFYPVPFAIESNMYFEADPYTGFRLKPGGIGHFQLGIPAVANSHGHRDVEVTLEKPPGIFRILALGDSLTAGVSVRLEEAYPKVLERLLRGAYGPRIQVVNSAVGGWQPLQYAEYFEHYGYQFDPDLILVGLTIANDPYDESTRVEQMSTAVLGHRLTREAAAGRLIGLKVFLYDHSNLARLLLNRGATASPTFIRKQCDDFTPLFLAIQKEQMASHLRYSPTQRAKAQTAVNQIRRIRELADARVPVIVALLPGEDQVNRALQDRLIDAKDLAKYDFNMPQSMLTDMFGEIGIPTIDLLPAVRADHRCLYMNDTHWTAEGNELAAAVIFDKLAPIVARMLAPK
jgi:hypothetical protein